MLFYERLPHIYRCFFHFPLLETEKPSDIPSGTEVKEGDIITYSIVVTNKGEGTAENVIIKDAIPEYTVYVDDSASSTLENTNITSTMENGKITFIWIVEALQPGQSVTVSFKVKVGAMTEVGTREIKNVAQIKLPEKGKDPTTAANESAGFTDTNEIVHTQEK